MREDRGDSILILDAAEEHFREKGDKVKVKTGNDPHAVYDVLRGHLTRYAYGRVGKDWMDAEDCVQDAYVSTITTAKVNEFFNFGGLYKIWLDRAIRDKNKEKRKAGEVIVEDQEVGVEGLTLVDIAESELAPPDYIMEVQGRVDDIMEISNGLKPKIKAIVRLAVIFGYTNIEVAAMMNIEIKQVSNALEYFRKRL